MSQDFYVTLFSSDSIELHPHNTNAVWTTEFDTPIILDNDYSVGISSLYLNATLSSRQLQHASHDSILFPIAQSFTSENFFSYLMNCCVDPEIITEGIFEDYLRPEFNWTAENIDKTFRKDMIMSPNHETAKKSPNPTKHVVVEFKSNAIMQKTEENDDSDDEESFKMKHRSSEDISNFQVFFDIEIEYTVCQILNFCVRSALRNVRHDILSLKSHFREFVERSGSTQMAEIAEKRRKHLKKCSIYVTKFIKFFVSNLLEKKKEMNVTQTPPSNFLLIYSDVIEEQVTSNIKTNLLHIRPYQYEKNVLSNHLTFSSICYYRCSKRYFKNISIKILDESGNPTKFLSGFTPNFLVLHFKKNETVRDFSVHKMRE